VIEGMSAQQLGGPQVDVHRLGPRVAPGLGVIVQGGRHGHAGIEHQGVEPSVGVDHALDQSVRRLQRREVGLERAGAAAAGCYDLRRRVFAPAVVHGHGGPGVGEGLGGGPPDAAARASHENGLVRQVKVHGGCVVRGREVRVEAVVVTDTDGS
jgi:O-acetyl-ADP-ribose deacetylase (regulator of RNase III)